MLEKKDIQELFRGLELAAQESDQAAEEARAQLARAEALLSRLEEWRAFRQLLAARGVLATIPSSARRKPPIPRDPQIYRQRTANPPHVGRQRSSKHRSTVLWSRAGGVGDQRCGCALR